MSAVKEGDPPPRTIKVIQKAVARFAGDSGDGVQLMGNLFSSESAISGLDISTLPNYPAEIRAPAGTLYGVSSYQIQFGSQEIYTPGDEIDTLVAFNPAALKVHLKDLKRGGILILNTDAFDATNLKKAHYTSNPLEDPNLSSTYRVIPIPITRLTREALKDSPIGAREKDMCKNFWALGLLSWLYHRPLEPTIKYIQEKFKKKPEILEANLKALRAGYNFGETAELFHESYDLAPAHFEPGTYRAISGNQGIAWGLLAAAVKSGLPLVYASYPITPASDILHELSRFRNFRIRTIQAEDEIAAVTMALGAAYGGALGVTGTSGPGFSLKQEAIGLAVMAELPLVILDIQRAGPSTGMPTKPEQADLLQALFGRHGESPVVVMAISRPGDALITTYEAVRIAVKYMVPVVLLSDAYIANGSEPWRIVDPDELKPFEFPPLPAREAFAPYRRDPKTLARPWVTPGTPGYVHRIGGLEKEDITGNVSYDPDNHEKMVNLRLEKIRRVQAEIPPSIPYGDPEGGLLVVGWGSSFGPIRAAVEEKRSRGYPVSHLHLHFLNPLPPDLGDVLRRYDRILVPEMNAGQLRRLLRSEYLVDARGVNRIRGLPLFQRDISRAIDEELEVLR
jgi:2-oxoglutarate ferredoxin oxidoreductase subunit alpha